LTEITLVIGNDADCADGFRGELIGVVIDPAAGLVTHLAVEPKGRSGLARLVPLDLAQVTPTGQIGLSCDEAAFKDLSPAEETLAEFVPGYDAPVQLLAPGWRDAGGPVVDGGTIPRTPEAETVGIIPPGEVEEQRGDQVHATDGDIGRLRGLRIDADGRQVTHVLITEGHLHSRKEVAIPFGQVTGFDDGIQLSITKQQVRDLRGGNQFG
jgi:sporulation protein YlmC with PRC-barrel domain